MSDVGRWLSAVLLVVAAASAVHLARRSYPSHRVVALALSATAALNLGRAVLQTLGAPIGLDRALYLAFPAISAPDPTRVGTSLTGSTSEGTNARR